jgi:hypothetical protein
MKKLHRHSRYITEFKISIFMFRETRGQFPAFIFQILPVILPYYQSAVAILRLLE